MAILDDLEALEKKEESLNQPDRVLSVAFVLLACIVLGYLFVTDLATETNLVNFSYVYVPSFFTGVFSWNYPPKKALLLGAASLIGMFLFYVVIWPAL